MTEDGNPFRVDPYLQAILMAADIDAWFKVAFNGIDLFLPAGTIQTMAHCLSVSDDGTVLLNVETAHLNWMRSRLAPGAVFLDVGAATGAMTLPIAKQYCGVEIIAFEPARRAYNLLKASLIKNDLTGVKVVQSAVSSQDGTVSFAERPTSGRTPFLPETSTIIADGEADPYGGDVIEVNAVTLDTVGKMYGLNDRLIVMKIDIEGFEVEALQGASALLRNDNVFLAIDIHKTPGGVGTTEAGCRSILSSYGYRSIEKLGHVIVCAKEFGQGMEYIS